MNLAISRTKFANLSPIAARAVLALTIVAIVFFVAISLSPLASGYAGVPSRGPSDVELYHAEIARIAQGQTYHAAADAELHARGYPTRSIFNWRTPLPIALLGVLPGEILGRLIIGALALVLLVVSLYVMRCESSLSGALVGGLFLIGALLPCWLHQIYVMPEVWSGVAIALSICLYAIDRRALGFVAGLAALFIRELALPYCIVCLGLALANRRWQESRMWIAGFFAYTSFYLWHVSEVLPLIGPRDHAHIGSWLQFGGAAFVISLTQMNAFLLLLPQWISAIYLPLAMLGFAAWKTTSGERADNTNGSAINPLLIDTPATRAGLTASLYIVCFAFVGHSFNQYWGSLIAPLFTLGIAQAPVALHDLFARAKFRTSHAEPALAGDGQ